MCLIITHRATYTVVGGTHQPGNYNTNTDAGDKKRIWEQGCRYVPALAAGKIEKDWVGLRPVRNPLRLEAEVCGRGTRRGWVSENVGRFEKKTKGDSSKMYF